MLRTLSKKTTISDITWLSKDMNDFLYGFLSVFWYNGYNYHLKVIRDYINEVKYKEDYSIKYPKHILNGEVDSIAGILWSILVIMFGEYGTSPRFGWLEKKEIANCVYFLDWFIELFEESEDEYEE